MLVLFKSLVLDIRTDAWGFSELTAIFRGYHLGDVYMAGYTRHCNDAITTSLS
jgi:hypothetical protein